MFQHGDQATYRMNQYLEAQAQHKQRTADKRTRYLEGGARRDERAEEELAPLLPVVAKLVRAVATESNEPLGWCREGHWYVTMDRAEHAALREKWG
ncbi:hypothetical protein NKH77_53620 [Streptomyces sp. M19]